MSTSGLGSESDADSGREALTRETAIDRLAERIYWTLERHEPSEDDIEWANLREHDRDLYRECVENALTMELDAVRILFPCVHVQQ
ncbi:MAG: hypothetical protein WAS21_17385 [Geminicoccaceae bacterium]